MKKLIIILILFTSCGTVNKTHLRFYNYHIVNNRFPNYNIKEFRRFSYIFDVYNDKDSIRVVVDKDGYISKTIKLK